MNTTFKEIIYNIKNLRQAGKQSQDSLLSDEQYAFIIDQYREKLIDQEYAKRKALAPQLEQTLTTKFRRQTAMEEDMGNDLHVYKALNVPRLVMVQNRPYYTGIRTSLLAKSITRSTSTRIRYDVLSAHTGDRPRYFPLGDDLFLVTPEPIQELYVTGVFERPFEVWKLDARFNPFDPFNFEYPITLKMLDPLYKMMTDAEIKLSMITPNDLSADGREEAMNQRVPQSRTREKEDED